MGRINDASMYKNDEYCQVQVMYTYKNENHVIWVSLYNRTEIAPFGIKTKQILKSNINDSNSNYTKTLRLFELNKMQWDKLQNNTNIKQCLQQDLQLLCIKIEYPQTNVISITIDTNIAISNRKKHWKCILRVVHNQLGGKFKEIQ